MPTLAMSQVRFTNGAYPPLGCAVLHVCDAITEEKMVGPNAKAVIGFVQYPQPIGNRAEMELP